MSSNRTTRSGGRGPNATTSNGASDIDASGGANPRGRRKRESPPAAATPASADPAQSTSTTQSSKTPSEISQLLNSLPQYESDEVAAPLCAAYLRKQVKHCSDIEASYNVVVLIDEGTLLRSDADRIYSALKALKSKKDILLVIYSSGGEIEPAYLIGKLCREHCSKNLHIAVPRRAKSAATLIACAADVIHMGALSELGPIDPQIDGLPALALKNALEHIVSLAKAGSHASELFSEYLARHLKLQQLGYYERVAESAAQYAERLLLMRSGPPSKAPAEIARRLLYEYKDHGFVIDANEARGVFGQDMIQTNTKEYEFADSLYEHMDFIHFVFRRMAKRNTYFIGSLDSGLASYPIKS